MTWTMDRRQGRRLGIRRHSHRRPQEWSSHNQALATFTASTETVTPSTQGCRLPPVTQSQFLRSKPQILLSFLTCLDTGNFRNEWKQDSAPPLLPCYLWIISIRITLPQTPHSQCLMATPKGARDTLGGRIDVREPK